MVNFNIISFVDSEEDMILNSIQREKINNVMSYINSLVNLSGLSNWCKENEIEEIVIFGSQTRFHQKEESDLDVMLLAYDKQFSEYDWKSEQIKYIDEKYATFQKLVNKDLQIDFKLNLSDEESYYGITWGEEMEDLPENECDFLIESNDIPSYISVTPSSINFCFAQEVEEVMEENGEFKKFF